MIGDAADIRATGAVRQAGAQLRQTDVGHTRREQMYLRVNQLAAVKDRAIDGFEHALHAARHVHIDMHTFTAVATPDKRQTGGVQQRLLPQGTQHQRAACSVGQWAVHITLRLSLQVSTAFCTLGELADEQPQAPAVTAAKAGLHLAQLAHIGQ